MPESKSNFRPRISLLSFLLGISLVAVGISNWQNSQRLQSMTSELLKLRSEAGYLTVDDKTKFHALAVESGDPNIWKWRIFIPKGTRYQWNIACENIPQSTPPAKPGTSSVSNEPYWETDTNVLVTAQLKEADSGDWRLTVSSKIGDSRNQMGGATLKIPADQIKWIQTSGSNEIREIGSHKIAIRDTRGPIILLQKRPCEKTSNGRYSPSTGTMPGYEIWLSEVQAIGIAE